MAWLRRIAAVPLLLFAFVCAVGAARAFSKHLPNAGAGTGAFYSVLVAALLIAVYFLIRPDLRGRSKADIRRWILSNPLGQAAALYVAATILMLPVPQFAVLPGLLAQCAYSVIAPVTARRARSWWAHAGLSVLGFALLMFALAGTSEAITPRGFGEAGMLMLLPMYGFPILLAVSGIARMVRNSRMKANSEAGADV